ncbi:MAG: universal stress protein [Acidimicrobiales bacterium]|jgi:nucleotide-binding universal stress UspA family protein
MEGQEVAMMDRTEESFQGPHPSLAPKRGRVVVGVDGSDSAHEALRYAAAVARWQHWTLEIVHAWHVNYPLSPYGGIELAEITSTAADVAARVVRDAEKEVLGDDSTLDIRHSILEGLPARTLIDASEGADLVVVGSRGRGGFSSLALGSVGQACVHHAHCPVLIVRPKTSETSP